MLIFEERKGMVNLRSRVLKNVVPMRRFEHLAWFPYRRICRICRVCRTKKNHRTDRIHPISYNKLYLSFLLY